DKQVYLASRLAARHVTVGHPPEPLLATMAHAVLREDAGFHSYQMLEAGIRQFTACVNGDEGRHILVAVARYLGAHSPTERATLQTADIARRLMRGGELHEEAAASRGRDPSFYFSSSHRPVGYYRTRIELDPGNCSTHRAPIS